MMNTTRQGTLLIIVAGLSAMLAALSATYLSSIRSRERDNDRNYVDAQTRLLLYAACAFIVDHNATSVEGIYPMYSWAHSQDVIAGASAPFVAAENCPSDTWFRIAPGGSATQFRVSVGVDLSRGMKLSTHAADKLAVRTEVQDEIGLPSLADVENLQRQGHREHFLVTYTAPSISSIVREPLQTGAW